MSFTQIASLVGLLIVATGARAESAPLSLTYVERAPFMHRDADGVVRGSTATPSLQAFEKAGIAYTFKEASPARALTEVRQNKSRVCSIGWYKTQERESFAKFSKPVSQDTPMVGFANSNFRPPKGVTVDALLADTTTTVLVKNTIVYGPFLEQKFESMKATRVPSSAEYAQLVRLIQVGRSSLTFLPYEEVAYYINDAGLKAIDFNIIHFKEMPPGERRHIMCSMSVDDKTIARLNTFIPN